MNTRVGAAILPRPSKKFLRVTKINLGDASNKRERECIFIPLKIAKRKRYKERR